MAVSARMTDPIRRSPPRITRWVRVPTPGLRARINHVLGDLINVSATGALIRSSRMLAVGSEWPVTLDLDARRIDLSGRVVRYESTALQLPGGAVLARPLYALGVVFTSVSSAAMQAIVQLCGGRLTVEELPYRILVVGDDAALNAGICQTLTDLGYQVRVVTDARQVVDAAKDSRADAAVIHVALHREPSTWWVVEVLKTDPATALMPLLALAEPASVKPDRARYLAERHVRVLAESPAPEALQLALQDALREAR